MGTKFYVNSYIIPSLGDDHSPLETGLDKDAECIEGELGGTIRKIHFIKDNSMLMCIFEFEEWHEPR